MHVVVAGGGITGLAAALRLAEGGAEVTLVERSSDLGGMLRTSTFAGRMVDEGADAFLIRTPAALSLARRVGLGDELTHPAQRRAFVWHDGALRPLPPQVLGVPVDLDALAASGLLSADGLARLRRELSDPASPPPSEDISIGEALGLRLGDEALATLVDPLVGGINAGSVERQSLAAVAPQLDAARRDRQHASLIEACRAQVARARAAGVSPEAPIFAAPRGGMARLPAAVIAALEATGRVEVRLGAGVATVAPGPVAVLDDGTTMAVDGLVLATPAPAAAAALMGLAPDVGARLAAIEHVSVAFVRLALPPNSLARPLDGSGLLVPRAAGRSVTACSWTSSKWAHLAPEAGDGTVVLRAAVGRDDDQGPLDLDDDELVDRVVDDLAAVMGLRGGAASASVHRWTDAFPQYRPGHLARVAAAEAALAAASPTVALAGMYFRGVGIPAAVASGEAAADRLLATITPR